MIWSVRYALASGIDSRCGSIAAGRHSGEPGTAATIPGMPSAPSSGKGGARVFAASGFHTRSPGVRTGSSSSPSVGRETYAALRRRCARSPWVDVVMDRRRGERRQDTDVTPSVERRVSTRRTRSGRASDAAAEPAFRLALRGEDWEVYESTAAESGRCPECVALVSIELPRFVEPPVRLELVMHHAGTSTRARHVVEPQSLSPTGRVLLATRIAARTRREPGE
jgi:hypothetical protein